MMAQAPHLIGRTAIAKEIDGLRLLQNSLAEPFDRVVETILSRQGRVFVAGIGKSGHVARKIAATLSSTGTQAHFIHPAEASHGDLGMIGPGDLVMALSNSGETQELSDLLLYCGRWSIPLVGITSRAESVLARAATLPLVMPQAPEACLVGMAPTTSTTMMMALGDAIAVALMTARGFTAGDFRNFHPGGRLGQTLMRVEKIMRRDEALPLVALSAPMSDVLLTITSRSLGCAGVVDGEGRLVGVITDGDLRRHMDPRLLSRRADEIMSNRPRVTRPDALVGESLARMNHEGITCLFVTADEKPVGVITLHDCLRAGFS
ncbi:KpsF/GutQ family sugar-phosphate isomerase [Niveispirillum sp. SYP-B3756]|uniref:KpsF/GutQ family sugar-phosphate isomerase n=1 Tax=Niveispirillum sp. SYP-B3756 TaxID=2662178 RepID=UPI00129246F6|nr:KpsF/GutQ family sugar-phosphate isomerase [Niveispirillum sp. SYP-B3756]MQP64754.1 KpsF/GutQ family sugar-phosphate isomerase [Niveispirillum sp. SYP-B3756]